MHSQTHEVVCNVYDFMKREIESTKPLLDFCKVQECVPKMTGISHNTKRKIVKESQQLHSPNAEVGICHLVHQEETLRS